MDANSQQPKEGDDVLSSLSRAIEAVKLAKDANTQRPKKGGNVLSSLKLAIEAVNLAKDVVPTAPAKAVLVSVSFILTKIKVCLLLVRLVCSRLMYAGFHEQQNRLCRPRASLR
jgi:hypothetical protein